MLRFLPLALLLAFLPTSFGRTWKNASGDQSFEAAYLSNDGKLVTLWRGNRILTFAISKLHPDDQAWLRTNHPPKSDNPDPATGKPTTPVPKGAAFDTLEFGDTRKEVIEKLGKSQLVESTVPEVMLARVGLNGSFRTKQTIGGLHCHLYFDWNDSGKLKEVTLRTKPKSGDSYSSLLQSNWGELIKLLTILHGDAVQELPTPMPPTCRTDSFSGPICGTPKTDTRSFSAPVRKVGITPSSSGSPATRLRPTQRNNGLNLLRERKLTIDRHEPVFPAKPVALPLSILAGRNDNPLLALLEAQLVRR